MAANGAGKVGRSASGSMPSQLKPIVVASPNRPRARIGRHAHLPRSETVLLLVDYINPMTFPEANALAARAVQAAKATATLKARLSRTGAVTIYANDNYGHWRSAFHDILNHCISLDGAPRYMAELLTPTPDDVVILKPRHSGFFGTPLELLLAQMHTRNLVIAGIATDICVQLTAMDASLRGYNLWIPRDCTAAESQKLATNALAYMKRVLKAHTSPSSVLPAPRPSGRPDRSQRGLV
jgi:nicotinamidase-related amidase